jgi:hypothetical protein
MIAGIFPSWRLNLPLSVGCRTVSLRNYSVLLRLMANKTLCDKGSGDDHMAKS